MGAHELSLFVDQTISSFCHPSPLGKDDNVRTMTPPEPGTGTIILGERLSSGMARTKIFYDDQDILKHRDRPYLFHYIYNRTGLRLKPPTREHGDSKAVSIPTDLLSAHAVIVGKSSRGKTRLLLHLLREQLRAGCSAVMIDLKEETLQQALAYALEAGLTREQITVILPRIEREGVPGWNPYAIPFDDVVASVSHFCSLVKEGESSWGPRMGLLFSNAATVIAGQGLSLYELIEFLQSASYRSQLLKTAEGTPAWRRFRHQHRYFIREFNNWSPSKQDEVAGSVLNKLHRFLNVQYMEAMMCQSA